MALSILDRFLTSLAPGVAVRRAEARQRLRRLETGSRVGGYEGAAKGRRTDRWHTRTTDANAAIGGGLTYLRARSHDLVRNNAYAARAVSELEAWTVGPGITGQPIGTAPAAQRARQLWLDWSQSTACDADGDTDFAGLVSLAFRTAVESGSALVRRRVRRDADGLQIPLQLQVLEPDHLDMARVTGEGRNVVQHGIEYDAIGRRVAFWLFPEHPGSDRPGLTGGTSKRVPASEVLHVFRQDRPGQILGVPWLAPALIRLRNLDEFEDAALLRATVGASFALYITRPVDPDTDDEDEEHQIEDLEPGTVEYLNPGESIQSPDLPDFSGLDSFTTAQLRAIAGAVGMPYELLTGDLSKVNYSSARLGFNSFERAVLRWQQRMLRRQMLDPVAAWFVEAAAAVGQIPAGVQIPWQWTPPARAILDPGAENKADSDAIRSGLKTLTECLLGRGKDPRAHLEELSADLDTLDDLDLPLDSSPRHAAKSGAGASPGGAAAAPKPEASGKEVDDDGDDEEAA